MIEISSEIVVEKRNSSAFHDTHLHRHLSYAGIDRLVIAGMQTEMCVDSACRGAKALNYRVALVADGHTTYDTPVITADLIIAHHNRLLSRAFVELVRGSFNVVVVEPARLARQFKLAAWLSTSVPVKSLSFPRTLGGLAAEVDR